MNQNPGPHHDKPKSSPHYNTTEFTNEPKHKGKPLGIKIIGDNDLTHRRNVQEKIRSGIKAYVTMSLWILLSTAVVRKIGQMRNFRVLGDLYSEVPKSKP